METADKKEDITPSKRLRNVLFAHYKLSESKETFDEYYARVMRNTINKLIEKLELGEIIK